MNGETDFLVLSLSFIQCQHNHHIHIQSLEGHVIGFHQPLLDLAVFFFHNVSIEYEERREIERKENETKDM